MQFHILEPYCKGRRVVEDSGLDIRCCKKKNGTCLAAEEEKKARSVEVIKIGALVRVRPEPQTKRLEELQLPGGRPSSSTTRTGRRGVRSCQVCKREELEPLRARCPGALPSTQQPSSGCLGEVQVGIKCSTCDGTQVPNSFQKGSLKGAPMY